MLWSIVEAMVTVMVTGYWYRCRNRYGYRYSDNYSYRYSYSYRHTYSRSGACDKERCHSLLCIFSSSVGALGKYNWG